MDPNPRLVRFPPPSRKREEKVESEPEEKKFDPHSLWMRTMCYPRFTGGKTFLPGASYRAGCQMFDQGRLVFHIRTNWTFFDSERDSHFIRTWMKAKWLTPLQRLQFDLFLCSGRFRRFFNPEQRFTDIAPVDAFEANLQMKILNNGRRCDLSVMHNLPLEKVCIGKWLLMLDRLDLWEKFLICRYASLHGWRIRPGKGTPCKEMPVPLPSLVQLREQMYKKMCPHIHPQGLFERNLLTKILSGVQPAMNPPWSLEQIEEMEIQCLNKWLCDPRFGESILDDHETRMLSHYAEHKGWTLVAGEYVGELVRQQSQQAPYVPIAPFELAGINNPDYARTYHIFSLMMYGDRFRGGLTSSEINGHCANVSAWLDDPRISSYIGFNFGMQLIRFCKRMEPKFRWFPRFLKREIRQAAIFDLLVDNTGSFTAAQVRERYSRTFGEWVKSGHFAARGFVNSCLYR